MHPVFADYSMKQHKKTTHLPQQALASLYIVLITYAFVACSNSEYIDYPSNIEHVVQVDDNQSTDSYSNSKTGTNDPHDPFQIKKYLPLDDSEYPYAGIPRIVIETENHQAIKDRETEIPAKLQIWGENAPESEIMDLTIRGRGNTTWKYPKKPYAIKFNEKQKFLGMPKAKKWIMLANYRDRTLIRNALALETARKTNQKWTPQGRFADVFLNNKFIGNYYICEKIEVKKNRLELSQNSYLLEFDIKYDETYKFKTAYKKLPTNIKYPNTLSDSQFQDIQNYIDTIECSLYGDCKIDEITDYINLKSLASFWIVQEIAQNWETLHPKSVYAYKDSILNFGPVWDFDWQTFTNKKKGFCAKYALWFYALSKKNVFREEIQKEWASYKEKSINLVRFIDSLANYTKMSNEMN